MGTPLVSVGTAEVGFVNGRPAIRGECDASNAGKIAYWLSEFGDACIDVDLSGVTFIDAATLRALLNVRRRNPNMRIVAPSPIVQRVLAATDTVACALERRDREA
jgi:anti-anti-sigma factor